MGYYFMLVNINEMMYKRIEAVGLAATLAAKALPEILLCLIFWMGCLQMGKAKEMSAGSVNIQLR